MNEFKGTFKAGFVGDRLQVIVEEMSPEQLASVRDALEGVRRRRDVTAEDVAVAVEKSAPNLAAWVRGISDLCNQNQGVLTLITILLMVILPMADKPDVNITYNDNSVSHSISQLERGEVVERPPVGQRQMCFCSSGKRYKNCHGRDVRARFRIDPPS